MIRTNMRSRGVVALVTTMCGLGSVAMVSAQAAPPVAPPPPPQPQLQEKADRIAEINVGFITRSHGMTAWRQKSAVQANVVLSLHSKTVLEGVLTHEVHRQRARLELKDGTALVFDGERSWIAPANAELPNALFHIRTWPFFFTAPFRLHTQDVQPLAYRVGHVSGAAYDSFSLKFSDSATSPMVDDVSVYSNPRSKLVHALSFTSPKDAPLVKDGRQSHCVIYDDYKTIEGVTLATKWTLWNWKYNVVEGEPIGVATLSDVKFITPPDGLFDKPADAGAVSKATQAEAVTTQDEQ